MQAIPILLRTGLAANIQERASVADDTIEKPFGLHLLQQKIEDLMPVNI